MNTALDHLNMTVRNFEESVNWYQQVFGFEIVERGTYQGRPWGVIKNRESMFCIYESPSRQPAPEVSQDLDKYHRIYHFGLRILEKEFWLQKVKDLKLKIHHGPISYPHSTSWYVFDPSGHEIEVVHWNEDGPRFEGLETKRKPEN